MTPNQNHTHWTDRDWLTYVRWTIELIAAMVLLYLMATS